MTPTYPRKLIEVALPLPEINDASSYDKMPGIGPHPKGIHHWWARLPLPCARAVLFASVVTDPSDDPAWKDKGEAEQDAERERLFGILRRLLGKKLHEHPEGYEEANKEMLRHCDGKLPPVLDPFSGGGSIPLEAARLGFEAHAADLNPVAVLLNKCNLELAPRWAGHAPVNPDDRESDVGTQVWTGTKGLAADVRYYGRLIRERALEKIGHLYPKVKLPDEHGGGEANVIAWLWTRTVASPDPSARGAHVPLVRSFTLSGEKGKRIWVDPVVDKESLPDEALDFRVQKYGIRKHWQMFALRQLVGLVTLSDLVREVRTNVVENALAAGLAAEDASDFGKTVSSDFTITATWPVRASQTWRMRSMGSNALASYIVLACRQRAHDAPRVGRNAFVAELKRELPPALRHLQQGNVAPVDFAQAAIGPGMAVFSRYSAVLESSGKSMSVRTVLGIINGMKDELLGESVEGKAMPPRRRCCASWAPRPMWPVIWPTSSSRYARTANGAVRPKPTTPSSWAGPSWCVWPVRSTLNPRRPCLSRANCCEVDDGRKASYL